MEPTLTLKAARYYQARGLAVFPLNGKVPITTHGVKDAASDDTFDDAFQTDGVNIGVAIPPGVVVVDVDPRNGGDTTIQEWWDSYGYDEFADAPCVATGGGGNHYWFRYDGRALVKAIDGVDFQRLGKYVVAPPSRTDDEYTWLKKLPLGGIDELPELPGWLLVIATPEVAPGVRAVPFIAAGALDELDDAAHRYTSWFNLLSRHGWTPTDAAGTKWRHPATDNKFSATITNDCLFVYSPNTPFPVTESGDANGTTLFGAISLLDFNGDDRATAAEFRARGLLPELAPSLDELNARMDRKVPQPAALRKVERGALTNETTVSNLSGERESRLRLRQATGTDTRRVRWLWKNRIPTGSLTLLAGREGEGKSTIAIDSIARVTRGTSKGEFEGTPRDALIVATEDSYEHTIMPRLLAAGADTDRVWFVEMLEPGDSLSLPVDIGDLEAACNEHDVALIVLDPLLSRLDGRLDSHKDGDVRRALEPLGAFADRLGCSILGLIHLNKGGSTDPLQAIMASRAFTAFARAVLFAMVDPDNPNRRLLGLVKSNLGPLDLPTLTYTFEPVEVGFDDGPIVATHVAWGDDSATNITDALQSASVEPGALMEATEWLRDYLDFEGGSCVASAAIAAGKKEQHSDKTIRRAREKLGIVTERTKSAPPTVVWRWPNTRSVA